LNLDIHHHRNQSTDDDQRYKRELSNINPAESVVEESNSEKEVDGDEHECQSIFFGDGEDVELFLNLGEFELREVLTFVSSAIEGTFAF
jgi:hypothetical protein